MAKHHLHMQYHATNSGDAEVTGYATRENLDRALKKHGFDTHRHVVVRTLEGGYTAIFPQSNVEKTGGYIGFYSDKGFMLFG